SVEQTLYAGDHVGGHPLVDLLSQLDEPERVAELAHRVGQVRGIDGYAVPADTGAGQEPVEPERLGRGRLDGFPQVDAQLVTEDRHLVDEGDVDVPVGVLQQLGHLGLAGAADGDDLLDEAPVEGGRPVAAGGGVAADHLGGVAQAVLGVARVDALGREGQVEPLAGGQPGRFEQGTDQLVRGPRPGGGFEHDERAFAQVACHGLAGALHGRQVGPVVLVQGGGDADDDRAALGQDRLVEGGAEPVGQHVLEIGFGQVIDVRLSGHQSVDLGGVDVDADDLQPGGHRL